MVLEPVTGLVRFVVGLLVGGVSIYVAARVVTGESSFGNALVTAVVGAVAWGLTDPFLGWVPLVGSLLPLVVWVGVVKWRYDVGWVEGAIVGFLAWFVSALALLVLPFGGDVFGVPFV